MLWSRKQLALANWRALTDHSIDALGDVLGLSPRCVRVRYYSTYLVKGRQVFRSLARCLTLLKADATPALQHLPSRSKTSHAGSAFNSPSIGHEVLNSLLANNQLYISEGDWAAGCFANSGKTLDCESFRRKLIKTNATLPGLRKPLSTSRPPRPCLLIASGRVLRVLFPHIDMRALA